MAAGESSRHGPRASASLSSDDRHDSARWAAHRGHLSESFSHGTSPTLGVSTIVMGQVLVDQEWCGSSRFSSQNLLRAIFVKLQVTLTGASTGHDQSHFILPPVGPTCRLPSLYAITLLFAIRNSLITHAAMWTDCGIMSQSTFFSDSSGPKKLVHTFGISYSSRTVVILPSANFQISMGVTTSPLSSKSQEPAAPS
jgi:hypothetical protein